MIHIANHIGRSAIASGFRAAIFRQRNVSTNLLLDGRFVVDADSNDLARLPEAMFGSRFRVVPSELRVKCGPGISSELDYIDRVYCAVF